MSLCSSVPTHTVGLCGFHFSAQVEIENVVFGKDWNEFVLSMPVHQFLKMNSHSLTNFAVNRNHVTTVMSEVEILSSFARDLCSAAQHFVCTNVSSIRRSCSLQLLSRFIFTHSNRSGLLVAPRSKLPRDGELAEVS